MAAETVQILKSNLFWQNWKMNIDAKKEASR